MLVSQECIVYSDLQDLLRGDINHPCLLSTYKSGMMLQVVYPDLQKKPLVQVLPDLRWFQNE